MAQFRNLLVHDYARIDEIILFGILRKNVDDLVDYVVAIDSLVLPVEVKAGKTGTLKSLKLFIEEKKSSFGVRFSQEKLSLHDKVLTLPLYMAEQMKRLVREGKIT